MLGLASLTLLGFATYRLFAMGGGVIAWIAAIVMIVSFWSWGVLMRHRSNPEEAPDWPPILNTVTFVASIVLVVVSITAH